MVPRRDADRTRGCAGATTTRRPRSPTTSSARRTRGAAVTSRSSSCSTPASSTTTATGRSMSEYAQGATRRHAACGSRVDNAGPTRRQLHVLPTLWFRNTWSWETGRAHDPVPAHRRRRGCVAEHPTLGTLSCCAGDGDARRCCSATTRPTCACCSARRARRRIRRTASTTTSCTARPTVNPAGVGTKAALHYRLTVAAGGSRGRPAAAVRQERRRRASTGDWTRVLASRARAEADEFYAALLPAETPRRRGGVCCARRSPGWCGASSSSTTTSTAGCDGDPTQPAPAGERLQRPQRRWRHLNNHDVISMPDTWEYPWYAAWDLAFHCVALAHIDPEFAKQQLLLLCREWYMHPNGQLPAYEWDFSDANPPVHAWAAMRVFEIDGVARLSTSSRRCSTSCSSTSPGGSTARTPRATTCSRAASSAWTTSARSTGRALPVGGRAGAERRHRVDGEVLPRHARDGAARSRRTTTPTKTSRRSSSSTSPTSRRRCIEQGAVGRGGRLLLRRAAHSRRRRDPAAGPLDGRAAAAVRGAVAGRHLLHALPEFRERHALVPPQQAASSARSRLRTRPRRRATGGCCPSSTRTGCVASWRGCSTRTEFLSPLRPALLSRAARRPPGQHRRRGLPRQRRLRAGRVAERAVRRQLQLARSDLVPAQLPADRVAAPVPHLPRRLVHRGAARPAAGGRSTLAEAADDLSRPARGHLPAGRATGAAGVRRLRAAPATDPRWQDVVPFHEYFHGDTGWASAPRTRPAGPAWWRTSSSSAGTSRVVAELPRDSWARHRAQLTRHRSECALRRRPRLPPRPVAATAASLDAAESADDWRRCGAGPVPPSAATARVAPASRPAEPLLAPPIRRRRGRRLHRQEHRVHAVLRAEELVEHVDCCVRPGRVAASSSARYSARCPDRRAIAAARARAGRRLPKAAAGPAARGTPRWRRSCDDCAPRTAGLPGRVAFREQQPAHLCRLSIAVPTSTVDRMSPLTSCAHS